MPFRRTSQLLSTASRRLNPHTLFTTRGLSSNVRATVKEQVNQNSNEGIFALTLALACGSIVPASQLVWSLADEKNKGTKNKKCQKVKFDLLDDGDEAYTLIDCQKDDSSNESSPFHGAGI